jgi:hypothetical protein
MLVVLSTLAQKVTRASKETLVRQLLPQAQRQRHHRLKDIFYCLMVAIWIYTRMLKDYTQLGKPESL